MEQEKTDGRSNRRKWTWLIIPILLILFGACAGLIYKVSMPVHKNRLARDELALGGMLPGKTPEEIDELLNQKVEEGMVNIGIAAEPVFEEGGKKGRIGIENIAANRYSFQVVIALDETGEKLYESGIIDPGYYIEFIELNRTLESGDYPATAVLSTYSLDESEDKIAETHVKLLLHVLDGAFYR